MQKATNKIRGLVQSWGTSRMRRFLWNHEFASGKWTFTDDTSDDFIYRYLSSYGKGKSILDLGCGSGNTACELQSDDYSHYTGVDVSDVALEKARNRVRLEGRSGHAEYRQGDITSFEPVQEYDVILFRESLPYIPKYRVGNVLARYACWLNPSGVFIVSWCDRAQLEDLLADSRSVFSTVEMHHDENQGSYIEVLRLKSK